MEILLIIAALLAIGSIWLHKSADKEKEKFRDRPATVVTPSQDLFPNQKYAIIRLMAYIQGASPKSAYDDEANRIMQSTVSSLGLSFSDVEKCLKASMNRDPEREINRILSSLDEIRDQDFKDGLYRKCLRIALISEDEEMIATTKHVFRELGCRI